MKSGNGSVVVGKSKELEVANSQVDKKFKPASYGRVGRPNSLSEEKLVELLEVYYSKPYSLRQLADMFGVSRMTVWRAVQMAALLM